MGRLHGGLLGGCCTVGGGLHGEGAARRAGLSSAAATRGHSTTGAWPTQRGRTLQSQERDSEQCGGRVCCGARELWT